MEKIRCIFRPCAVSVTDEIQYITALVALRGGNVVRSYQTLVGPINKITNATSLMSIIQDFSLHI